jgi:hypothetical protein
MADIVMAATNRIQPLTSAGKYKPLFCHEAVLGWLLISLDYPHAWELVRKAAVRIGSGQSFNGGWMYENIYSGGHPLSQATVFSANAGDVLWTGGPGIATHSVIVVGKTVNSVSIRGFNNFSTFQHLRLNPPPPESAYDGMDRDVAGPAMWNVNHHSPNTFGWAALGLFREALADAQRRVAQQFPWESSTILPCTSGQRWHHNLVQGWHWS